MPERKDMSGFLSLIYHWWTIINGTSQFNPNPLANAIIPGDGKIEFLRTFADWIETWNLSPAFCLTKHTSSAFIQTLRAQTSMIEDLFENGFSYVIPRKLQSDPLERRFSKYRQMSGGRFLVGLRDVLNSEKILSCKSLLLEEVNFWKENLDTTDDQDDEVEKFKELIENVPIPSDASLSEDGVQVAIYIAGYIAKKLLKKRAYSCCHNLITSEDASEFKESRYFQLLSRGKLTVPSSELADFVIESFAILDFFNENIMNLSGLSALVVSYIVLERFGPSARFTCEKCNARVVKKSMKIVINIFFNNQRKISKDSVRKDCVNAFKKRQRSKYE